MLRRRCNTACRGQVANHARHVNPTDLVAALHATQGNDPSDWQPPQQSPQCGQIVAEALIATSIDCRVLRTISDASATVQPYRLYVRCTCRPPTCHPEPGVYIGAGGGTVVYMIDRPCPRDSYMCGLKMDSACKECTGCNLFFGSENIRMRPKIAASLGYEYQRRMHQQAANCCGPWAHATSPPNHPHKHGVVGCNA